MFVFVVPMISALWVYSFSTSYVYLLHQIAVLYVSSYVPGHASIYFL